MNKLGGFDLLLDDEINYVRMKLAMLRDSPLGASPIEQLLSAAIVTVAERQHHSMREVMRVSSQYPIEEARRDSAKFGNPSSTAYIQAQVQLPGWRVDFVLYYPDTKAPLDQDGNHILKMLIIECDGHAFHERTRQQAARDRARDRWSQYQGVPVLRFTGSEIWNDPTACAYEVMKFMER